MLRTLMEMRAFVYGMVGVGGLGVILMLVVNKLLTKKIQDKDSYEHYTQKLRTVAYPSALVCLGLVGINTFGTFQANFAPVTRYKHMIIGLSIMIGLICVDKILEFTAREHVVGDYILDHLPNIVSNKSRDKPVKAVKAKDIDISDKLPSKPVQTMAKAVQETAASKTKYGKFLTPEEEDILRDIIHEYMT